MKKNALHQSLTAERYTPPEIAGAVKNLYKDGFFDLASCSVANQIMGATGYYSKNDDALSRLLVAVLDDCFCNPPGGKLNNQSLQRLFWEASHQAYREHRIRSLVFLCFNLNAMALCPDMLRYPAVFTTTEATSSCVNRSGRIRFLASCSELKRIIYSEVDQEMEKLTQYTVPTDDAKKRIWQKAAAKLERLSKLPVVGDDLVQESSPANPGVIVFLPPRAGGGGWLNVADFRREFEQFGTFVPGRVDGQG